METRHVNDGLFASRADDWRTPKDLFHQLDVEFGFGLDPCASPDNALTQRFFTTKEDGLAQVWTGSVFMNPPYGRAVAAWVAKAFEEARRGATVVCLIAARTDTTYWHDYVMQAHEIRLIRGRLKFGEPEGHSTKAACAPFPSCVVIFRAGRVSRPLVTSIDRQGRNRAVVPILGLCHE